MVSLVMEKASIKVKVHTPWFGVGRKSNRPGSNLESRVYVAELLYQGGRTELTKPSEMVIVNHATYDHAVIEIPIIEGAVAARIYRSVTIGTETVFKMVDILELKNKRHYIDKNWKACGRTLAYGPECILATYIRGIWIANK